MPPPSQERLASLDILRAIAVFLVIVHHAAHGAASLEGWGSLEPAVAFVGRGGWVGVDLFFVLSGYLVSGLLFREYQRTGGVRVGRFLVRRGLKIYPAFYVLLAFTVTRLVADGAPWEAIDRRFVASEALFVQNYGPRMWWHTWSLAVEEHFYLICAGGASLLVALGRGPRDPFRRVPVVFAVVASAALAARVLTARAVPTYHVDERRARPGHR